MRHGYQVRPGQARASKATGRKLMCPRGNTPVLKTGSAALHSPIPQKCVRGGMGWSVASWGCLPASRGNPLAKIQSSRPPSSSGSRAVPWITAGTHRPVVSASHRKRMTHSVAQVYVQAHCTHNNCLAMSRAENHCAIMALAELHSSANGTHSRWDAPQSDGCNSRGPPRDSVSRHGALPQ